MKPEAVLEEGSLSLENSSEEQDYDTTDLSQIFEQSDQLLLSPEFYKSLQDSGIDSQTDFPVLFLQNSGIDSQTDFPDLLDKDFLSLEGIILKLDESSSAVGETQEIREFIENLMRIRKEQDEEQQRLEAANGLRIDAPSFVPSAKLVEQLDAKTKIVTK